MPFRLHLVGGRTNDFYWDSSIDAPMDFETGAEAQAFGKRLMATNDEQKWRVKRVLDTKWKSREQRKYDTGFYSYLPWASERWWMAPAAVEIYKLHYPHVSRKQPGMMAYTESVDKGMDNKQTQIKVGRYLEKYFGDYCRIYAISMEYWTKDFESRYAPRPVFFTDDPDKIQWVYETGPHSCMSSRAYREKHGWGWPSPGRWPNDTHAARVYAGGDLQVAYLTSNNKPEGKVSSRCVVWPAKKTMSRPYGDEPTIMRQLGALDYVQEPPIGAKLLRMPVENTKSFVLPYIDRGHRSGTGSVCVLDKKTHLEICEAAAPNSYSANNTSGLSGRQYDKRGHLRENDDIPTNCHWCETPTEDVGELYRVWRSANITDCRFWCEGCVGDHAYICDYNSNTYCYELVPMIKMEDGSVWSEISFRMHGFKCDATGKCLPNNKKLIMYNRKKWDVSYARDHAFQCAWSGDWYPIEMKMTLTGDAEVAIPQFEQNGFTCAECGHKHMIGFEDIVPINGMLYCHDCQPIVTRRNEPELGLEERA